jgi:hypothetical protein
MHYDMICNDDSFISSGGCVRRLRKQKVHFDTIAKIIYSLYEYFKLLQNTNILNIKNINFSLEKTLTNSDVIQCFGEFMVAQISDNTLTKYHVMKQAREFSDINFVFPSPYNVKNQLTLFQTLTRIVLLHNELKLSVNTQMSATQFINVLPNLLNTITSNNILEIKKRVKIGLWFVSNNKNHLRSVDSYIETETLEFIRKLYDTIKYINISFD